MKKKIPQVVALQYNGEGAPLVTAKGKGDIAKQILEVAASHNIPLYQNADLTELLAKVKLGEEIPEKLYHAVAKVLYFIYMLDGKEIPQLPNQNNTDKSE